MNPEQTQIESAIVALEFQLPTLGDAVLEMAHGTPRELAYHAPYSL